MRRDQRRYVYWLIAASPLAEPLPSGHGGPLSFGRGAFSQKRDEDQLIPLFLSHQAASRKGGPAVVILRGISYDNQ